MLNIVKNSNKISLSALGTLVALVLALVPGAASATAPVNDDYENSLPLLLNTSDTRSNVGASIGPEEGLTANDPDGDGCTTTGDAGPGGVQMDGTLWWDLIGNGGPVTISTVGSNFDTVLAVYDTTADDVIGCDDDIQPGTGFGLASEVVIQSVAGRHYDVQVGGCAALTGCNPTTSGEVTLRASSTPPNDRRANAAPITAGRTKVSTSKGATVESGEVTNCTTSTGATSLYGKTVWFRWHAPAPGTASFTVSGFDTVLAVYRGEDAIPFGCNDDAISKAFGGSSLPMTQPPGAPISVAPGDYLIQVGGFYDLDAPPVAARDGQMTLDVQFTENLDVDGDGVTRPLDCNDNDPSIHPGAAEITNNDTDENCDGILAFDRDHDGYLARPAAGDCNDHDPGSHPGARDIPGNRVDEDCNGVDARYPRLDTTIITGSFHHDDGLTTVRSIQIQTAPAGAEVELACHGRGCRFDRRRMAIRHARSELVLHPQAGRLRAGARLRVQVTKPGYVGVARSFTMHRTTTTTSPVRFLRPTCRSRCT
jgi:Putative metal-binding motif